jgi:hypothetical protein
MSTTYGELRTDIQKTIDEELLGRIKAGIALLEEEYGSDWVEHIDMETFDISDTRCCVLGQLYGHYTVGSRQLGIHGPSYGFDLVSSDHRWDDLQEAWEYVLTPRISA